MNNWWVLLIMALYFMLLMGISYATGRKSDNEAFFLGNRQSPWYVVAFGMIGASLSGVTFISIPGWVAGTQFSYMQMVLGYLVGYAVISQILLPLYYRLELTSIYTYLEQRFGQSTYKTGASFFLISRVIGASFRLYLVAIVLELVFQSLGFDVPFVVTVVVTVLLIWIYTAKGGIKTIIWTDTLQTLFMLIAAGVTVYLILGEIDFNSPSVQAQFDTYSRWWFWDDWCDNKQFIRQFFSGAFIAIVMTGLDQDMMQKNLSCRNLGEAQKNMYSFSLILVVVNLMFLVLGALLYIYAAEINLAIPERTDLLYPTIALGGHLGPVVAIFFILGLIASAYSSADSALTALTTSFCVDILAIDKKEKVEQLKTRKMVHIGMSVVLVIVIVIFKVINDESVIKNLFVAAGYTYGPLLGIFAFGLFTKQKVRDPYVPLVAILSPVICFGLSKVEWGAWGCYKPGFELLIINGVLTFVGLLVLVEPNLKKE